MKFLREFFKLLVNFFSRSKKHVERDKASKKEEIEATFQLKKEYVQTPLEIPEYIPIRQKRAKVHLQVGLDFGTSFSKVIVNQIGRRQKWVHDFGHNLLEIPRYCCPSMVAVDNHGNFLFGPEAFKHLGKDEWDCGFQRLKVIVAGKYNNSFVNSPAEEKFYEYYQQREVNQKVFSPEKLTALFLAYIMHNVRQSVENTSEYSDCDLDIAFNICVPIEHYENNELRLVFDRIFQDAEAIYLFWREKGRQANVYESLEKLADYLVKDEKERRVFSVPESVAGIASYINSLHKEEGLHGVIDLGSGTTDVSVFNLMTLKGETECVWYSAKNIPRGAYNLERIVFQYVRKNEELVGYRDILSCFNSLNDKNYRKVNIHLFNEVRFEIKKIWSCDEYKEAWRSAYRHLRKQTKWENVRIFLSGGGSTFLFAKEIFKIPWWPQIYKTWEVNSFPIPDDYEPGRTGAPFERMTVAYGLSYSLPELSKYTLPKDAPDHTPPRVYYSWEDREVKYAK